MKYSISRASALYTCEFLSLTTISSRISSKCGSLMTGDPRKRVGVYTYAIRVGTTQMVRTLQE